MRILCFLIFVLFITACNKGELNDSQSLIGKWIYSENYSNTLEFVNSSEALINNNEYAYSLIGDSIEFSYVGQYHIYIKPSKHKFELVSKPVNLIIEDMNKTHFFNSDEEKALFLKDNIKNDFIGFWISLEKSDTIIFVTNQRLERPHGSYNDWLEYSANADNLRFQYTGPDKLYVPEINYGYDFEGDTLVINYHTNYYPNFTSGIKKYLKK